ncbi:hypothetical protein [Stenotrophomonas sp. S39]|uniref:hypothetical protein n=1 Tax=Stenotrophomonas sp. S39 TaxID=2767451 RepID=UPI00190CE8A4|nr:hypothetical protein [Stenotrophomonas sp. S39]MBK0055553.1 hypothetical protein [Stenotrophomonas sp. S39]
MHNESPLAPCRAEPCSADETQPTNGRLYQQRQRARRTALWVGAIAVLVYVGFILSGVIGR